MHIPYIVEKYDGSEKVFDLYSKLLLERIIFIEGEINDKTANIITSELLYLDSLNNDDIYIYINSPGGSITSGFAIYDTIGTARLPRTARCGSRTARSFRPAPGRADRRYRDG